jgi:hypothetical protein
VTSSILLSEEHCWSSKGKKLKTPMTGAQGTKNLAQNLKATEVKMRRGSVTSVKIS